jgi:hypothetical protein
MPIVADAIRSPVFGTHEYAGDQVLWWEDAVHWWAEHYSRFRETGDIASLGNAIKQYNHWRAIYDGNISY